jgi:hypothetical protein
MRGGLVAVQPLRAFRPGSAKVHVAQWSHRLRAHGPTPAHTCTPAFIIVSALYGVYEINRATILQSAPAGKFLFVGGGTRQTEIDPRRLQQAGPLLSQQCLSPKLDSRSPIAPGSRLKSSDPNDQIDAMRILSQIPGEKSQS